MTDVGTGAYVEIRAVDNDTTTPTAATFTITPPPLDTSYRFAVTRPGQYNVRLETTPASEFDLHVRAFDSMGNQGQSNNQTVGDTPMDANITVAENGRIDIGVTDTEFPTLTAATLRITPPDIETYFRFTPPRVGAHSVNLATTPAAALDLEVSAVGSDGVTDETDSETTGDTPPSGQCGCGGRGRSRRHQGHGRRI